MKRPNTILTIMPKRIEPGTSGAIAHGDYVPGPGYTETLCEQCEQVCFIGPRLRQKRETSPGGTIALCVICVNKLAIPRTVTHLGSTEAGTYTG